MGIPELRKKIDEIDSEILKLLNKRAEAVIEVGKEKTKLEMDFHVPQREEQILQRLTSQNPGPFPSEAVRGVYREIISACLSLEHPLKVAYMGPKATFSHLACLKNFGLSAHLMPVHTIADVFSEVEKGLADYGVVPVENSSEGVISHTLDMFVDSELKICGEILIEVSHNLLSKSNSLDQINKVYSHPHAIAQSGKWLKDKLSQVRIFEVSSTANAAEMAAEEPGSAAIASELAASLYNLKVLASRIEDSATNFTRFLITSKKTAAKSENNKTSIMFSIKDRVGALLSMLQPFAKHSINLTKIESRPSKKKAWEYVFFVDFDGHLDEERVKKALEELSESCVFLKVLGSYPKATQN